MEKMRVPNPALTLTLRRHLVRMARRFDSLNVE
jgi:hypothetical protein